MHQAPRRSALDLVLRDGTAAHVGRARQRRQAIPCRSAAAAMPACCSTRMLHLALCRLWSVASMLCVACCTLSVASMATCQRFPSLRSSLPGAMCCAWGVCVRASMRSSPACMHACMSHSTGGHTLSFPSPIGRPARSPFNGRHFASRPIVAACRSWCVVLQRGVTGALLQRAAVLPSGWPRSAVVNS
jgi:hypothetical protein